MMCLDAYVFLAGGGVWALRSDGVERLDAPSALDGLLEAAAEEQERAALAMLIPWRIRRLSWWERGLRWWRKVIRSHAERTDG